MTSEIATVDNEEEDSGMSGRQVAALQALYDLGAAPRKDGEPYSPDRRIRAQQLIYEGRLGGPGRGQNKGSKRQPRASAAIAEYVRENLTPRIQKALKDGLHESQDISVRLKTADMALKVEQNEASLQLKEEQSDLENANKEQLIAALIALASDPGTEAALQAAIIDLPEAAITEITEAETVNGNGDSKAAEEAATEGNRSTVFPEEAGADTGEVGSNGRIDTAGSSVKRPNPFTQVAHRRAINRRRAS